MLSAHKQTCPMKMKVREQKHYEKSKLWNLREEWRETWNVEKNGEFTIIKTIIKPSYYKWMMSFNPTRSYRGDVVNALLV